MNRKTYLLATTFLLLLSACKKNNENTDDQGGSARYKIITSGSWQITAYYLDIHVNGVTLVDNLLDKMEDCEKDDRYIFNANATVTLDEGPTKCKDSDPQQEPAGTWQLVNNDTQLKAPGSSSGIAMDIVELNETTMRLSFKETPDGEPTRNYELVYTHIQ